MATKRPSSKKPHAREAERRRREASDYEALGADNYRLEAPDRDAGYEARGKRDKDADRQKKQEYSRSMGEFADAMRDTGGNHAKLGRYISALAEDERRFENRRLARSISLAAARDELHLRRFVQAARLHLTGRIVPKGCALRKPKKFASRTVNILLSDLHFGAWMSSRDNPEPFGPEEESRRFAKIVAEVCDYKPQHRAQSRLNVLLNGDLIDGLLLHDMRDGAPLTEQATAFWKYLAAALAQWSRVYPSVHVECQPGNHGRNKLRHPGRATSSKWDGEETKLAIGLSLMCSNLANVTFGGCGFEHFRAVSSVPLYGVNMLMTHGDTEIKLADPDTRAAHNANELAKVNSTRIYGCEFALGVFGHFHKHRRFPWRAMRAIFNGALVPPNGHARSEGYTNEICGQTLFESVEGYPVGDLRYLEVGASEDNDPALNKIVPAFRF